jgi:hypothetical protein
MSASSDLQSAAPAPAATAGQPAAETGSRPGVLSYAQAHYHRRPSVFANWFWFAVKNIVGWLLILTAMVMGPLVPGPGGLPLFLIGFGLITFPGKRRITARVLSGAPVDPQSRAYRRGVAGVAIFAPAVTLAYLLYEFPGLHNGTRRVTAMYLGLYVLAAIVLRIVAMRAVGLINLGMRIVPKIRRKIRPWLRRRGIDLLPPRRRHRRIAGGPMTREPDPEILSIHKRHQDRVEHVWAASKPWLKRGAGLVITAAIFFWMLRPLARNWEQVKDRVLAISWGRFFVASAMFSVFLFTFRATTWRWILISFGARLPVAAATRIWSLSELARYLPGVIWQVLGRMYLVKPYGIRGSVCSTSQILELAIFLLANMLLALACLVWFGIKSFGGPAQVWLYGAMALVPVLTFLLHPSVLYSLINRAMARLGKPAVIERLGFKELIGLLVWSVLGLMWQSLAIWFLVAGPLNLPPTKWWVVAGAYALAWCAGFLAFWAPGGIGVRELVFMAAMQVALPPAVRNRFQADPAALTGFLAFLSVLLRLWTIAGELMLAAVAYLADYRGAPPPPPPPPAPDATRAPAQASLVPAAAPELD